MSDFKYRGEPFTPSSADMLGMVEGAMAKCDAAVEQARLQREARANASLERALIAEAKAKTYRRILGH